MARGLCREAASAADPLSLERWTSTMLGHVWRRRRFGQDDPRIDPMLFHGEPMVRLFADEARPHAKVALTAIGRLDRGPLGRLASSLAASAGRGRLPRWIDQVGSARVIRAIANRVPGDGESLLLEADDAAGTPHMVAAFISELKGGIASQLGLIRRIDPQNPPLADDDEDGGRMQFKPVDAALACRRVRLAIERTDAMPVSWIEDTFVEHRAIALARITAHAVSQVP